MKQSDHPKISVVTPSFNQGKYIEDTILSVIDQNYPNYEFFVCDAGSKDGTVEVIQKYDKHITWWCSEKDKGHTDAINKGLRRSTGDILCYMNSDDFFLPNAFHYISQAYRAHPHVGLFTGNGIIVDGRKANPKIYMREIGFTFDSLLRGSCYLLQPSTFVSRNAWEKLGEFDDSLHFAMDLDYWLRVAKDFDVLLLNEPLSAWRMHEDIKTPQGALVRWTELWRIYRKFTKDQLTPGLLVEFFTILQNPLISEQLGMDVRTMGEKCFNSIYAEMQHVLRLKDCVPVGKGNIFKPTAPSGPQPHFRAYPQHALALPLLQPHLKTPVELPAQAVSRPVSSNQGNTSKPRVDIVLQATGAHAWSVGGGWENAARKLGLLNRVFRPQANWGNPDVHDDDGLFRYLGNPQADVILLAGFDWHSQMLHMPERWQERWRQTRALKLLYVQESVIENEKLSASKIMEKCFLHAAELVDAVIYTDLNDRALMEASGKPALFQPFGVDDQVFHVRTPFAQRIARAFFRGKHQPFVGQTTSYQDRRAFIQHLLDHQALQLVPYKDGPITPDDLAMDFNRYQVAVNFPSVFSNHPTRVYEAMACGCALVTNRTGVADIDREFEHGRHLLYYSTRDELLNVVRELTANPTRAARIADEGCRYTIEKHALHRRLDQAIQWLDTVPRRAAVPVSVVPAQASATVSPNSAKRLVIDGVIFHLQQGHPHGISRVWRNLLEELGRTSLAEDIVLLDRDGTAPVIPGIRRRFVGGYDFRYFEDDSLRVQKWCDEEDAALFISTYHTYAENTPTMIMLHDMIPEVTGQDLSQPEWRAKTRAIEKSCAFFSVSQSTINDFRRLYPQFTQRPIFLAPNAVGDEMRAASSTEVRCFRERQGIEKPYFLVVGHRSLYKNAILFFRAFALLPDRNNYEIVCVGGASEMELAFKPFTRGVRCHLLRLNNTELCAAYSGATALVYPSKYEGFGLPILEAQKCDCPVITCHNSSIPEVGGNAAIYVDDTDVAAMLEAITKVRQPETRTQLIAAGRANTQRFSWCETAQTVIRTLCEIRAQAQNLPLNVNDPIDTIGRLTTALSMGSECAKTLSRQLSQLVNIYRRGSRYDHDLIARCERYLAEHLGAELPTLRMEIAAEPDCDHFLLYVLGIVAEQRRDAGTALRLYTESLKRMPNSTIGKFRVRIGLRLVGLAIKCGQNPLAENLIEEIVIPAQLGCREDVSLETEAQELLGELAGVITNNASDWPAPIAQSQVAGQSPQTPLVTAIVSTYNSARFLRGCLDDLENQTIANRLEIIVIDSNSSQNERMIVEEYQKLYSNIVYIRTDQRETVYGAWNRAIQIARGKYLTNANTDDRHRSDAIEKLAQALEQHPEITLVYANCLVTDQENETFETAHPISQYHWMDFSATDLLLKGCFIGPQPMWRREVHQEHGLFDAQFVAAGDYEFWLRISRNRKFLHLNETLGLYLKSTASVEHTHAQQMEKEVAEARRRYGEILMPGYSKDKKSQKTISTPENKPAQPAALPPAARVGNLDQAQVLLREKKHLEAWSATIAAIQQRPFHPEAFLLLARIASSAGDSAVARRCADHAQQLAPSWKTARQFLKSPLKGNTNIEWPHLSHILSPPAVPRLSVCLIVRNEEQHLGQCLDSVRNLATQVIVVDTGSKDRTAAIAQERGATLRHFEWCDDFSAARNAALEHATGDWVLVLDADEELSDAGRDKLIQDVKSASVMAYRLPIVESGHESEGCHYVPRLFRNAPGLFFTGRIHENAFASLEPKRKEWGLDNRLGTALLIHHGYSKELTRDRNKIERNLRLIEMAAAEAPQDANLMMNWGLELVRSGQLAEGLTRYQQALNLLCQTQPSQVVPELRETLLTQMGAHYIAAQRYGDLVSLIEVPLVKNGPISASMHFAFGLAFAKLGRHVEAAAQMRHCLTKSNQQALSPVNPAIHGAGPHHCLALSLAAAGQLDEVEREFKAALKLEPATVDLYLDYAKFLFGQQKVIEALQILHQSSTVGINDSRIWELGADVALSQPACIEFACDWTREALVHQPASTRIDEQHAEALLLNQQVAAALPIWARSASPHSPRSMAALILCQLVQTSPLSQPPPDQEPMISREFISWYQRLVKWNAATLVKSVLYHCTELAAALPTAAGIIQAVAQELDSAESRSLA